MSWEAVGGWLKKNGGTGAALVGALLTGNAPAAIAAGVSLVSSATGQADPDQVLTALQSDPSTLVRLKELANEDAQNIREHLRLVAEADLKDKQAAHREQQETIRQGDDADDIYVRRTRPRMARQSWYVTAMYVMTFEALHGLRVVSSGANWELAMILAAPAMAYLGFRTWDKRNELLGAAAAVVKKG